MNRHAQPGDVVVAPLHHLPLLRGDLRRADWLFAPLWEGESLYHPALRGGDPRQAWNASLENARYVIVVKFAPPS